MRWQSPLLAFLAVLRSPDVLALTVPKPQICSALKPRNGELAFNQFFSGSALTEHLNNPGNNFYPYEDRKSSYIVNAPSACDAIEKCAYFAQDLQFKSFDLHYYISQEMWQCVAYYERNTDAAFFNVSNPDVAEVYGYSLAEPAY